MEKAPRKQASRRHWPRLRFVAGKLVVLVEK